MKPVSAPRLCWKWRLQPHHAVLLTLGFSSLSPPKSFLFTKVFSVLESTYQQDSLRYLLDYFVPAKHLLHKLQQHACVSAEHTILYNPKQNQLSHEANILWEICQPMAPLPLVMLVCVSSLSDLNRSSGWKSRKYMFTHQSQNQAGQRKLFVK